jgi:GDP-L-fucose synthase
LDLTKKDDVFDFFAKHRPDYVIDAAAKVGGIFANDSLSGDFIAQNIEIQTNLIQAANYFKVSKFIFLGSVCIYPKYSPVPVKEISLLTGPLEPTNEAYAIAKISGIYMLKSFYKQYGLKSVSLMPSNIYGQGDNFDPTFGHVIPSLLSKMYGKKTGEVRLWGDGSPKREFLHADDLAEAVYISLINQEVQGLFNVGSGKEITIRELFSLIAKITKFEGIATWDLSKPNGTPERLLDSTNFRKFGWTPRIELEHGLMETWQWFTSSKLSERK